MSDSHVTTDVSVSLHVSKLTRNVSSEHLVEIFGTYGVVIRAEIQIDKRNGLSRGTATVVFGSAKEAESALTYLDGGQIDGKVISVAHKISNQKSVGNELNRNDLNRQTPKINQSSQVSRVVEAIDNRLKNNQNQGDDQRIKAGSTRADKARRSRSHSVSGKPISKYQSRERNELTVDARSARSRERGTVRSPSRSTSRKRTGPARENSDRFGDRNSGRGGRGAGRGGRREDSPDRGRRRGGAAPAGLSHYGPAPVSGRGGAARNVNPYGPAGSERRGVPPARGRSREATGRYVPVDRTRGRSRSRSPVAARRGGVAGGNRRSRSVSRSRSRDRGGYAARRRSPSRSRSRSPDSRNSSVSSDPRRRRRSYSASSNSSAGARYRRRARSFSRSTRSYSRSRSRSRSVSNSRSASRGRSNSPDRASATRADSRASPSRSRSRSISQP